MTKYLITMAYELDGHAGASSYYIQTEGRLTREQKLIAIGAALGKDVVFKENEYQKKQEGDMNFYGEMVFTFDHNGEKITGSDPVSITMVTLPSRMQKFKIYGAEARTG